MWYKLAIKGFFEYPCIEPKHVSDCQDHEFFYDMNNAQNNISLENNSHDELLAHSFLLAI